MNDNNKITNYKWEKKRRRIKYHLKQKNYNGLPRLVIFRSNSNIYTQLVDDINHKTLLSASSMDKDLKGAIEKAKSKIEKSSIVGKAMAEKIKKEKIDKIIFDRNGYKYHGRIKAVGDAIRKEDIQI
jgi:large subunit ribosomal protein L18